MLNLDKSMLLKFDQESALYIDQRGAKSVIYRAEMIADQINNFLDSDEKVLLLTGGTGVGKSTCAKHFFRKQLERYNQDSDNYLPLLFSLSSLENISKLAEECLKANLTEPKLHKIKHKKVVWILDGFDRVLFADFDNRIQLKNLYGLNHLDEIEESKFIFISRAGFCEDGYFHPHPLSEFRQIRIMPFLDGDVGKYLDKYVAKNPKKSDTGDVWTQDKYLKFIEALWPRFSFRMQQPRFLKVLLHVLPSIIDRLSKKFYFEKYNPKHLDCLEQELYDANVCANAEVSFKRFTESPFKKNLDLKAQDFLYYAFGIAKVMNILGKPVLSLEDAREDLKCQKAMEEVQKLIPTRLSPFFDTTREAVLIRTSILGLFYSSLDACLWFDDESIYHHLLKIEKDNRIGELVNAIDNDLFDLKKLNLFV